MQTGMNLKTLMWQIKMPFLFVGYASVNRNHHHHRRHLPHYRRRLRCRCHRSQSDCPNYLTRNGRRRPSSTCSSRRRNNCRHRVRSHRERIGDFRGGSPIASSAGSKPAMCRRLRARMPSFRLSSFLLAPNRRIAPVHCKWAVGRPSLVAKCGAPVH